jgi:hypothetical protein
MSPGSRREREQKALDALLVSQLRRHGCDDDVPDPDELPELTADEKEALEALGPNFVEQLLARDDPPAHDPQADPEPGGRELAMAGGELPFGLNRAEQIDPETAEELERRRKEVIERIRRRREQEGSTGG